MCRATGRRLSPWAGPALHEINIGPGRPEIKRAGLFWAWAGPGRAARMYTYIGMYKPAQGEEMTPEMMQEVHHNAQTVSIIKGSLYPEEYRKVQGREDACDICNILKMSHEGDPKAKRL
jgi:hypothetical protein